MGVCFKVRTLESRCPFMGLAKPHALLSSLVFVACRIALVSCRVANLRELKEVDDSIVDTRQHARKPSCCRHPHEVVVAKHESRFSEESITTITASFS